MHRQTTPASALTALQDCVKQIEATLQPNKDLTQRKTKIDQDIPNLSSAITKLQSEVEKSKKASVDVPGIIAKVEEIRADEISLFTLCKQRDLFLQRLKSRCTHCPKTDAEILATEYPNPDPDSAKRALEERNFLDKHLKTATDAAIEMQKKTTEKATESGAPSSNEAGKQDKNQKSKPNPAPKFTFKPLLDAERNQEKGKYDAQISEKKTSLGTHIDKVKKLLQTTSAKATAEQLLNDISKSVLALIDLSSEKTLFRTGSKRMCSKCSRPESDLLYNAHIPETPKKTKADKSSSPQTDVKTVDPATEFLKTHLEQHRQEASEGATQPTATPATNPPSATSGDKQNKTPSTNTPPATDKPATDKPTTDKPATDKKVKPNFISMKANEVDEQLKKYDTEMDKIHAQIGSKDDKGNQLDALNAEITKVKPDMVPDPVLVTALKTKQGELDKANEDLKNTNKEITADEQSRLTNRKKLITDDLAVSAINVREAIEAERLNIRQKWDDQERSDITKLVSALKPNGNRANVDAIEAARPGRREEMKNGINGADKMLKQAQEEIERALKAGKQEKLQPLFIELLGQQGSSIPTAHPLPTLDAAFIYAKQGLFARLVESLRNTPDDIFDDIDKVRLGMESFNYNLTATTSPIGEPPSKPSLTYGGLLEQARSLLLQHQFLPAYERAVLASRKQDTDILPYLYGGLTLYKYHRPDRTQSILKVALDSKPTPKQRALIDNMLKIAADRLNWNERVKEGDSLMKKMDMAGAAAQYQQALDLFPMSVDVRVKLADAYYQTKQWQKSLGQWKEIILNSWQPLSKETIDQCKKECAEARANNGNGDKGLKTTISTQYAGK